MQATSTEKQFLPHNNLIVLLADVAVSTLASLLSILFLRWQVHAFFDFQMYLLVWLLVTALASMFSFLVSGTQRVVIRHSSYRSIGRLGIAVLLKEVIICIALMINSLIISEMQSPLLLVFADLTITFILLLFLRLFVIVISDRISYNLENDLDKLVVMVYGTSSKSISMVTRLEESNHYNVIGFLTRERSVAGQIIQGKKAFLFENQNDVEKLKVNLGIESVLFARDTDSDEEQDGLVKMCLHLGIHILMSPKLESVNYGGMTQRAIKQVVDNDFIPDGMSALERGTKRAVDCLLSGILLVVFSPLILICWIAVKCEDGGPAIYKQERIGRFGRPFYIYKFRSMRMDAEAAGPALYAGDEDPRLTKVGKFLRQHHLDELPQLWNVFRGEMAFIGYRPERKYFIDKIMEVDPRYYYLYQIRPGVTSYATLKNGYTDSMDKMIRRLEFDLYYLRHRSWFFDMKILWQTFCSIVFGKKF